MARILDALAAIDALKPGDTHLNLTHMFPETQGLGICVLGLC